METIETINIFEEYEKLKADNERLQKVLQLIAEHPVEQSQQWEVGAKEMQKLARAALKEGE